MSPFDLSALDPSDSPDRSSALSESTGTGPSRVVTGLCVGDFHDRWDQVRQVAALGEAAVADLLAILQDDDQDWEARWFAARALGDRAQPEVIAALIDTFAQTADDDLRRAVAAALTQIGPPAIAALGQQLSQPALRPVAVQALARIYHPATVPLLLGVVGELRSQVLATALDALGAFADPATLPTLRRELANPAATVRAAAIRGLLNLRSTLDPATLAPWLAPRLQDSDLAVAQQAAYALGRLPVTAATEPLLQLLPTAAPALQVSIVQALLWQNTAPALAGLIAAWPDLSEAARLALTQGVATLDLDLRPQAALALAHWLRALPATPAHSPLRRHLILALGQIGTAALAPDLHALLEDPDQGVRLHAEAALRQLQP
ncbi:MAG TPA: HEAT repeat domain-containing protein [Nodosilinea sp.]|nr:HEAT repeat domain-containing protein [Nodosilinea sp.]